MISLSAATDFSAAIYCLKIWVGVKAWKTLPSGLSCVNRSYSSAWNHCSQSMIKVITLPCHMNITGVCHFMVSFKGSSVPGAEMVPSLKLSCILAHYVLLWFFFFFLSENQSNSKREDDSAFCCWYQQNHVQKSEAGNRTVCLLEFQGTSRFSSSPQCIIQQQWTEYSDQADWYGWYMETSWPFSPHQAITALKLGWDSGRVESYLFFHHTFIFHVPWISSFKTP